MFETPEFRKLIEQAVAAEAASNNFTHYQTPIVDRLVNLAVQNESILFEQMRKTGSTKGVEDAIRSAREVIKEAARRSPVNMSAAERVVTLAAFNEAYQAKFCSIWPFCR